MDAAELIFKQHCWEQIRVLKVDGRFTNIHIGRMDASLYRNNLVSRGHRHGRAYTLCTYYREYNRLTPRL